MHSRLGALASLSALALMALCGCGAGKATDSSTPPASGQGSGTQLAMDPQLHAALPANIRSSGTIKVGTSADYPPYESVAKDGKTIVGLDPDLAGAVGQLLGVHFRFVNVPFSSAFTGLDAGRYNIIWSDAGDFVVREKKYDILDYNQNGQNFLFRSDGPKINTDADACGHAIALDQGSSSIAWIKRTVSALCKKDGKQPPTAKIFPSQNEAVLAVESGRVDATANANDTNSVTAKGSNGKLTDGSGVYRLDRDGIDFPKGSQLLRPIRAALDTLRHKGIYQSVFVKWGIPHNSVSKFTINHGTAE